MKNFAPKLKAIAIISILSAFLFPLYALYSYIFSNIYMSDIYLLGIYGSLHISKYYILLGPLTISLICLLSYYRFKNTWVAPTIILALISLGCYSFIVYPPGYINDSYLRSFYFEMSNFLLLIPNLLTALLILIGYSIVEMKASKSELKLIKIISIISIFAFPIYHYFIIGVGTLLHPISFFIMNFFLIGPFITSLICFFSYYKYKNTWIAQLIIISLSSFLSPFFILLTDNLVNMIEIFNILPIMWTAGINLIGYSIVKILINRNQNT